MIKIHISRDRRSLGQFPAEEVSAGLASGRFLPTDLAWRDGMESWEPLATFDDLPPAPEPPPVPKDAGGSASPVELAEQPVTPASDDGLIPAWEDRDRLGLMNAALHTVYGVLARPASTFRGMRRTGGLGGPFVFYYAIGIVCGLINMFYQMAWLQILPPSWMPHLGENPAAQSLSGLSMTLAVMFLANLIVPFVLAGIYHGVLMVLAKTRQGYETTFRVYCYVSGAMAVFGLIPFPPLLHIQGVYFFGLVVLAVVYLTIALRESHGTTTGTALVCTLAPMVACCGLVLAVMLAGAAAVAGAAGAIPQ